MTDTRESAKDIPRFEINDKEAAVGFFEDNGFVIIKDFYADEDLNDFKSEVKNIINAYLINRTEIDSTKDDVLTTGILALEEKDHEYVVAIYDTIFQCPSFSELSNKIQKIHKGLTTH